MTSHAMQSAIAALTDAALRRVADSGAIAAAKVKAWRGKLHDLSADGRDFWVAVRETVSDAPKPPVSWLHPAGILFGWADAKEGDDVVVLRARRTGEEGGVAIHGFHRNESWLPPWLLEKVGLYARKVLRIQSTENDIELEPGAAKKIKLGEGATKAVVIDGDQVKIPLSVTIAAAGPAAIVTLVWTNELGVAQTLALTVPSATFNGAASVAATPTTLAGEVVASATKAVAE